MDIGRASLRVKPSTSCYPKKIHIRNPIIMNPTRISSTTGHTLKDNDHEQML